MNQPLKAQKNLKGNPETDHDTKLLRPIYEPRIPRHPLNSPSPNPTPEFYSLHQQPAD